MINLLKEERFAVYSHLTGFFIAIVGAIFLITKTAIYRQHRLLASIYSFAIIFLFAASTLYHFNKKGENQFSFWRVMDHIAIFIMIAGTYTPLAYIYLEGSWRWGIISAQWFLVILGIIFKPFILDWTRWIETVIYILMGWMAVIAIGKFLQVMPLSVIILVFTGGLAYTIGAIFHIINKKPLPGVFSFHDVFHIFIVIAGILHYFAIYSAITASFLV